MVDVEFTSRPWIDPNNYSSSKTWVTSYGVVISVSGVSRFLLFGNHTCFRAPPHESDATCFLSYLAELTVQGLSQRPTYYPHFKYQVIINLYNTSLRLITLATLSSGAPGSAAVQGWHAICDSSLHKSSCWNAVTTNFYVDVYWHILLTKSRTRFALDMLHYAAEQV